MLCKDAIVFPLFSVFVWTGENDSSTPRVEAYLIIHRFWATYRKVLDKNRLDLMASRLRFRDHSPFLGNQST